MRDARYNMVLSYPDGHGAIKQHYIRKGERINCAPFLWGHDPSQWTHPEQFNPDRSKLEKVKKNPHFGYGPHRCIGEKTAHRELLTIVQEVLANTRLMAKDKMPELLDAFTFRPVRDIKVHFDLEYKSLKYMSLLDIPTNEHNHDIYLSCVKNNGKELMLVPEDQREADICLAAVQECGGALYLVPEKHRTPELCLEAVKQDGLALASVPELLKTPQLCLAAVTQHGLALKYVPKSLRTPEICCKALENHPLALEHVPDILKTPGLCMEAVVKSGWALEYVPKEIITNEMCLAAVSSCGEALKYVPEEKGRQIFAK